MGCHRREEGCFGPEERRKAMAKDRVVSGGDERWGRFRFSVIGPLLAAPPGRGELREELHRLAHKKWRHPTSGQWVRFGVSTIERWYYQARAESVDPLGVLGRKIREDRGKARSLSAAFCSALAAQYREHPDWSYQLHADNMGVWVEAHPATGPMPSYATVRRYMKAMGLFKRRRRGRGRGKGVLAAEARFEDREIRSYESEYVNALWHLDFHEGSLRVLVREGEYRNPQLLGILDDHCRLCCHAQWYLSETTEKLVHGLCQGLAKRGLPRAIMSDNGGAMTSAEFMEGLERLGTFHETTLAYSAYQNGKQEVFWAQVEGRLLAMLSGVKDLTLAQLNEATLAWIEMEYNRKVHSELGRTPLACFLADRNVGRPCPSSEDLRTAFTARLRRTQRLSDGTISLEGARFEVPSRYRHLKRLCVRYSSWDLTHVYMADERTGRILCRIYPQDKRKNADGRRRRKEPIVQACEPQSTSGGIAPLLAKLIGEYAATGLPPAYLPKDETTQNKETE
jgi:transposase InsO family protein